MDAISTNYDHRLVATRNDPDTVHDEMRSRCPVVHSELHGGFWALTRYADVEAATRDTATFSSLPTVTIPSVDAPKPFIPVESDPPEHQKYRTLLNAVFTPRRIARFEDAIRDHARMLIAEIAGKGEADLAGQLVFPLTARVITWFLGIPDEDIARFSEWSLGLITVGNPEEELKLQMEIRAYYVDLIAQRIANPTDDLASHLLGSVIDGRPVTQEETLDIYLTLTGAGGETTAAAANHIFGLLNEHPEVRTRLDENRALIPSAVEEFLRYVTPVYGFGRTATRRVEIAGSTIAEGDRVLLSWLSANHDPAEFDQPGSIIVDRKPNRHLAFGAGVHRCPGAPLARMTLRVLIEEVLDHVGDYRLADPAGVKISQGVTRVVRSVPVTFTPNAMVAHTSADDATPSVEPSQEK